MVAATDKSPVDPGSSPLRVAMAAFVGTSVEWYDYYLYASAAAVVFGKLFFPELNAVTGTLVSRV